MDRRTMLETLAGAALLASVAAFSRAPGKPAAGISGNFDFRGFRRQRRNPHVERLMAQSVAGYRADAVKGNAEAQVNLAFMYRRGWGVVANDAQALCLFRQAAAQGHPVAQHQLALWIGGRPDDPSRA